MREALKGFDFKRSLAVLSERGILIPDGKDNTTRLRPPGEKQQRVYAIKAESLEDSE